MKLRIKKLELFVPLRQNTEMLEVKNVTIAVGEQVLAENLSFIAKDGELTCITGKSGSGKTTLVRTLMGFLSVKEGFVSVDGELLTVYSSHAFREMMVYMPQDVQSLGFQLEEPEAPHSEADDYAVWNEVLPSVEFAQPKAPLTTDEIVLLAEKTLQENAEKPIVIADEPTALLSSDQAHQMLALLLRQVEQGKTVVVVSRDPLVIERANQVINI
jgi:ABC-type cobalamin/Fe3+-siderophores transport system ATPase subunit